MEFEHSWWISDLCYIYKLRVLIFCKSTNLITTLSPKALPVNVQINDDHCADIIRIVPYHPNTVKPNTPLCVLELYELSYLEVTCKQVLAFSVEGFGWWNSRSNENLNCANIWYLTRPTEFKQGQCKLTSDDLNENVSLERDMRKISTIRYWLYLNLDYLDYS